MELKMKISKKELAERINVDPKTITNWETTKPELIKLIYLGLSAEEHILETEEYLKQIKGLKNKCQIK
jgi:transcriptional regulator with XRE-family HTH domain